MPFAGKNHFFGAKTSFPSFPSQTEKKKRKQINNKKNVYKNGVYQRLVATLVVSIEFSPMLRKVPD